jgi:replication factor A1
VAAQTIFFLIFLVALRVGKIYMKRKLSTQTNTLTLTNNRRKIALKIKELTDGMKRVEVEAQVVDKSNPRTVQSRYKDESYNVADATVQDDTGQIKLTLWNEQIDQVNIGDNIKIENGYITSFKGETQLNVGKFGKLTTL